MSVQYRITPASLRKSNMQRERANYHRNKLSESTLKEINTEELEGAVYTEEHQIFSGEDELDQETQQQQRV